MATAILKRTAAIWVPPRAVGERALVNEPTLSVMLPGADGSAPRLERASLEALPQVRSAALLFDARDVSLLQVRVPPLSGARLAKALPNLVEDLLLQDVQGCAFAVGPKVGEDTRLVAVIDRGWLDFVVGAFERRGVRVSAAWPAQLALPVGEGRWAVGCLHDSISLRTSAIEGFGWAAGADAEARAESLVAALEAASGAGAKPSLVVAYAADPAWSGPIQAASGKLGVEIRVEALSAPESAPVDLMDARRAGAARRWLGAVDWRAWRVPAAVAGCALALFLAGLNADWARLARERAQLGHAMEDTFRQTFPDARVVVDPMVQMQRRVSELRQSAGQSAPDDFLPLLTRFAGAVGTRGVDSVSQIEYRDSRLRVRFKSSFLDGPTVRESLRSACRQKGLKLEFEGEGNDTAVVGVQS